MAQQWHAEKEKLGKNDLDAREREELLYTLAIICPTVMRDMRGVVGDVSRARGGSLVAPPIDPVHIRRYFGDLKGFGAMEELVRIVTGGVPVHAAATSAESDLEGALQYGNHPRVNEHVPAVVGRNGGEVRRHKCLVMKKSSCSRNPQSKRVPVGGRTHPQDQDHKLFIV